MSMRRNQFARRPKRILPQAAEGIGRTKKMNMIRFRVQQEPRPTIFVSLDRADRHIFRNRKHGEVLSHPSGRIERTPIFDKDGDIPGRPPATLSDFAGLLRGRFNTLSWKIKPGTPNVSVI